MKNKKGFTLIEVLIAAVILVIVISLATVMFTKAENMNQVIKYEGDVSNVVDGMFNEILYGNNSLNIQGLSNANMLYQSSRSAPPPLSDLSAPDTYYLIYTTPFSSTQTETTYYLIAPGLNSGFPSATGTDTTLWQSANGSPWQSLDFNKKIILQSGSGFEYYNSDNQLLNDQILNNQTFSNTATYVQIILISKSNNPTLQNMPPVVYETSVRIKNKPSF